MSDKNSEVLEQILQQLKSQSNILNHLTSEISQLKQIIVLSRNTISDNSSSLPQPGFSNTDVLLSLDRPSQKLPSITDNTQDMNISSFPVNVEDIRSNINESNKNLIVDLWKNSQNLFNEVIDAKNNNIFEKFIPNTFELYLNIFKIFIIILDKENKIEISEKLPLTDIAKKIGPLPVIIDFDLLDFVNEKMQNEDYKIGEKTAQKLFEKLENSYISISEFLNLVL
ncbi:MAG: hypothetical protein ACW981_01350 [Candidatus Hodarchaeales archaeon]|jgi:hypothetical protein